MEDVPDDASDIVAEYEADDILMLATLIGIGPGQFLCRCTPLNCKLRRSLFWEASVRFT